MKKTMKRILLLLIAIISVFTLGVKASAPDTATMASKKKINPIGTMQFFVKKINANGKTIDAYCIDLDKKSSPSVGSTLKRGKELDAGYAYIIEHGYPNDSYTNMSADQRYAATQIAMWWYVDYLNGIENKVTPRPQYKNSKGNSYDPMQNFKNGNYKNSDVYKVAYELKEAAKKAGKYGSSSIAINSESVVMILSSDRKYYESNEIGVTANNINGNYTVSLGSAPEGTIVTDTKGNQKTSFSSNDKFIVKVPAGNFESLSNNLTVNVSAKGSVSKAYVYAGSSSYQSLATVFPEEQPVQDSKKITFVATKVKITKADITTGKNLPGAKLEIRDEKGNVVASWTTTEEDYYIDNLAPGKYTLIEIAAPDGYQLSTETATFVVEADGKIKEVTMYNAPEEYEEEIPEPEVTETVIVPDTGSAASTIMYILGAVVIIVGTGLVIRNVRKEKQAK